MRADRIAADRVTVLVERSPRVSSKADKRPGALPVPLIQPERGAAEGGNSGMGGAKWQSSFGDEGPVA